MRSPGIQSIRLRDLGKIFHVSRTVPAMGMLVHRHRADYTLTLAAEKIEEYSI